MNSLVSALSSRPLVLAPLKVGAVAALVGTVAASTCSAPPEVGAPAALMGTVTASASSCTLALSSGNGLTCCRRSVIGGYDDSISRLRSTCRHKIAIVTPNSRYQACAHLPDSHHSLGSALVPPISIGLDVLILRSVTDVALKARP